MISFTTGENSKQENKLAEGGQIIDTLNGFNFFKPSGEIKCSNPPGQSSSKQVPKATTSQTHPQSDHLSQGGTDNASQIPKSQSQTSESTAAKGDKKSENPTKPSKKNAKHPWDLTRSS